MRGHLWVPPAVRPDARAPGVIILHGAFGLTGDIVDIADRLAGNLHDC